MKRNPELSFRTRLKIKTRLLSSLSFTFLCVFSVNMGDGFWMGGPDAWAIPPGVAAAAAPAAGHSPLTAAALAAHDARLAAAGAGGVAPAVVDHCSITDISSDGSSTHLAAGAAGSMAVEAAGSETSSEVASTQYIQRQPSQEAEGRNSNVRTPPAEYPRSPFNYQRDYPSLWPMALAMSAFNWGGSQGGLFGSCTNPLLCPNYFIPNMFFPYMYFPLSGPLF